MNTTDSLPVYQRNGPHSFLFEGYAIFNEWLVFDRAAKTGDDTGCSTGRTHSKHCCRQWRSRSSRRRKKRASRRISTPVAAGHALLDRNRIDEIYRASIAPYEYWPMSDVGTSARLDDEIAVVRRPRDLVNYLYAGFVAVALYDRAQSDPDFGRKYDALLRRGFDADPKVLLASVGIQLDDPGLTHRAIALFKAKTDELEALYAADETPRYEHRSR